jgi:hypothetical protein
MREARRTAMRRTAFTRFAHPLRFVLALGVTIALVVPARADAQQRSNEVEITTANPTPVNVAPSPAPSAAPASSMPVPSTPVSASLVASTPPATSVTEHVSATIASSDTIDPDVVRRACRDATNIDWIAWGFAGVYATAGVALTVYGALYPDPATMPVPVGIAYMRGIGPGLILGAIGAPLARGVFATNDPLRAICDRVMQNGREHRDNPLDTYAADRVLRSIGAPSGFVMPLLIGIATAGCAVLTAIPFIIQDPGIAGPAGGISAAAIAAWVVLPPTPAQRASRRYVNGEYAVHAHAPPTARVGVAPLGAIPGVAVVGTF